MDEMKQALRRSARRIRQGLSTEMLRASDAAITCRVLASEAYGAAKRVFSYYSMGAEVSTHEILADAMARGKTVALPISGPDGVMEFYRYTGNLRPGRFGIMEPCSGRLLVPEAGDLMLVPGLCYDRHGHRLGHGAGYYDRYLKRCQCVTMGLCRDVCLMDRLPRDETDIPVNYVVTETRLLEKECGTSEEVPQGSA